MEKEFMSIGQLAQRMGVTVRTLQYYDRKDILKPSALSRGGRRLYTAKDMVRLHQIQAFKYLGFSLEEIKNQVLSLDSPEQMASLLLQQQRSVEEQITNLQEAARALTSLRSEVLNIQKVDFKKYAEIIELLQRRNEVYWVWKLFDDTMTEHIKKRFIDSPQDGERVYQTFRSLQDEAVILVEQGESPASEKSMTWAERWWNMILEFVDGDLTLITKLEEFNQDKTGWNQEMAQKQQRIDDFMDQCLQHYFEKQGSNIPERKENT